MSTNSDENAQNLLNAVRACSTCGLARLTPGPSALAVSVVPVFGTGAWEMTAQTIDAWEMTAQTIEAWNLACLDGVGLHLRRLDGAEQYASASSV
ncbi:hypothetical protein F8O06_12085 [Pseudoclavibacter sp. CFCC 14310]|uniref:hypothetical protein n=1 Tax=Pseudoclavibacter sp. CFCC 14310 TaxID=2615180 RepID=UPI00130123F0|nr:hypothetical protein [Pseudoclavibacter sp. CFCC 14310]KAB1643817.1 hypothetical protein F8O06_12085 [Pseudoclavibacter sp. CFCC 14310]